MRWQGTAGRQAGAAAPRQSPAPHPPKPCNRPGIGWSAAHMQQLHSHTATHVGRSTRFPSWSRFTRCPTRLKPHCAGVGRQPQAGGQRAVSLCGCRPARIWRSPGPAAPPRPALQRPACLGDPGHRIRAVDQRPAVGHSRIELLGSCLVEHLYSEREPIHGCGGAAWHAPQAATSPAPCHPRTRGQP